MRADGFLLEFISLENSVKNSRTTIGNSYIESLSRGKIFLSVLIIIKSTLSILDQWSYSLNHWYSLASGRLLRLLNWVWLSQGYHWLLLSIIIWTWDLSIFLWGKLRIRLLLLLLLLRVVELSTLIIHELLMRGDWNALVRIRVSLLDEFLVILNFVHFFHSRV